MSSIRFLYSSMYNPDEVVRPGSTQPVTGGAVYNALQTIQADALFETGYFSDGIKGYEAQHVMSFNNGTLKVEKDSILYYPAGIENGVWKFNSHKLTKDVTAVNGSLDGYNAEFFVDCTNEKLVCNTVRTLATNGNNIVQKVFAQDTDPLSFKDSSCDGYIWWDTSKNLMKVFRGGTNSWEAVHYSLPVGIMTCNGINLQSVLCDFLTCGYVDNYAFIHPGVIMLAPCGRTDDKQSSYLVEMFDTDTVLVKKMFDVAPVAGFTGFSDYKMYVTTARELLGAESISMDRVRGCYTKANGTNIECCPVATVSVEKIVAGQNSAMVVSSFTSRLPISVANKDDIDDVVKLVGSTHGYTIDSLEEEINELKTTLTAKINNDVGAVNTNLTQNYVKNKGNETIAGVKTFSSTIAGSISGKAERVSTSLLSASTEPEIIPVGLKVNGKAYANYTDEEKSKMYAQTTVRIGYNKVTAELFSGRATSMRWADLAEVYEADANYEPGTLVMFGGEKEITLANGKANAVISEAPAVLMNSGAEGLPVAMVGRVKVRVLGPCKKFDNIVLHENAVGVGMAQKDGGRVIGKALEDKDLVGEGLVLCAVQMNLE